MSYLPDSGQYNLLPEKYLENIGKLKKAVKIPVIGSLNGVSKGGWVRYAHDIQDAGADALELNIYYIPTDLELSGADVEQTYLDILKAVRAAVAIPRIQGPRADQAAPVPIPTR